MSQLHGKQLRDESTSLSKLSGTGAVVFQPTAEITFGTASVTYDKTPSNPTDVANKAYVDSVVQGLDIKESVKARFSVNTAITSLPEQGAVSFISGTTRVLLTGQSTPSQNGIWVVNSDAWTRPADFTTGKVTAGAFTFVEEGTYADSGFVLTTDGAITIDDTELTWVQFSSAGVIQAGAGLTKDGIDISVDLAANSGLTFSASGTSGKLKVATSIGGNGLTLTAGVLNVGVDTSGLSVDGTNVSLNDTITGARTFSNGVTINQGATVSGGLNVSNGATVTGGSTTDNLTVSATSSFGGLITSNAGVNVTAGGVNVTGGATVSGGLNVSNGATVTGGSTTDTLTVTGTSSFTGVLTANGGVTASTGFFTTSLQTPNSNPTNGNDVINLTYFGASYSQLQTQINNIDADFITAIEVGAGLTVSSGTEGTASIAILDTTAGAGLTFSNGIYDVNLGVNSGLTFSGDNIIVDTTIAGNGLDFAAGVLTVNTTEITSALAGAGLTANSGALDINVNTDGLEITNDVVTLKSTITGQRTFSNGIVVSEGATVSGQLVANNGVSVTDGGLTVVAGGANITGDTTVAGNFTVTGTVSYVNTQELEVTDNIITLAKGNTAGSGVNAGIKVDRGEDPQARFIWNEALDLWTAGLTGSEAPILIYAGTGLTSNGATVSIDTTGFATDLAGDGLVSNGGQLDVNVDTAGLTVSGDKVTLQTTITGGRTFSNGLTIQEGATVTGGSTTDTLSVTSTSTLTGAVTANNGLTLTGGATVSGFTNLQNNLTVGGTSSFGGSLTVTTGGATITGDVTANNNLSVTGTSTFTGLLTGITGSFTNLTVSATPSNPTDAVNLSYFGASYSQLKGEIDNINADFITAIEVGPGLTVSSGTEGTASISIQDTTAGAGLTFSNGVYDVNTGLGLEIVGDDVAMKWGGTATGLTISTTGVALNIDDTTLAITNDGKLKVIAGSAQPIYQISTGNVLTGGLTLSQTPNAYSRIEVYVNGLKVRAQGNVANLTTPVTGASVEITGATATWLETASYTLDVEDLVEIVYES